MTEPRDSETWIWVKAHFRRMGWKAELRELEAVTPTCGLVPEMVCVFVVEPITKAQAFCPVPVHHFEEKPANTLAPFIIKTIALAYGDHWAREKELARTFRRAAKALGATPEELLRSLKSRTLDIEIEKFMETQGGDDGEVGSQGSAGGQ